MGHKFVLTRAGLWTRRRTIIRDLAFPAAGSCGRSSRLSSCGQMTRESSDCRQRANAISRTHRQATYRWLQHHQQRRLPLCVCAVRVSRSAGHLSPMATAQPVTSSPLCTSTDSNESGIHSPLHPLKTDGLCLPSPLFVSDKLLTPGDDNLFSRRTRVGKDVPLVQGLPVRHSLQQSIRETGTSADAHTKNTYQLLVRPSGLNLLQLNT